MVVIVQTIVHRARSRKKQWSQIGVEELSWPAHNPDLNPSKNFWGKLECQLQTRLQCLGEINAGKNVWELQ